MEIFKKIAFNEQISQESLDALLVRVRERSIKCQNHVVIGGDSRFWDVSTDESEIIKLFKKLAISTHVEECGEAPRNTIVMLNRISSEDSPGGSGGGWHVDSVRNQYKFFMYLTDCTTVNQGPLCVLTSKPIIDRVVILFNFLMNKSRFSEKVVKNLEKIGFRRKPVLLNKLNPFFVNTSFIHKGLNITSGERILLTAYLFDEIPPSIKKRIAIGNKEVDV